MHQLSSREAKTLATGLYFTNGVELEKDGKFLIICETSRFRMMKYHLEGPKAGKLEPWMENMIGWPDNVRYSQRHKLYWVGCVQNRAKPFSFIDLLAPYPSIRAMIVRALPLDFLIGSVPHYGLVLAIREQGM